MAITTPCAVSRNKCSASSSPPLQWRVHAVPPDVVAIQLNQKRGACHEVQYLSPKFRARTWIWPHPCNREDPVHLTDSCTNAAHIQGGEYTRAPRPACHDDARDQTTRRKVGVPTEIRH